MIKMPILSISYHNKKDLKFNIHTKIKVQYCNVTEKPIHFKSNVL